jgi:hypothetical protein
MQQNHQEHHKHTSIFSTVNISAAGRSVKTCSLQLASTVCGQDCVRSGHTPSPESQLQQGTYAHSMVRKPVPGLHLKNKQKTKLLGLQAVAACLCYRQGMASNRELLRSSPQPVCFASMPVYL